MRFLLLVARGGGAYALGHLPGSVGTAAGRAAVKRLPVALFLALTRIRRRAFGAVALAAVLLVFSVGWSRSSLGAVQPAAAGRPGA